MGGRGTFAVRRNFNAGGGVVKGNITGAGGGEVEVDGSKGITAGGEYPNLKTYDIVSFNHVSDSSGKMTIRDADGKLHTSVAVSSGSTRTTYEFSNFVLKFEGLKVGGFPGQNEVDWKAYNGINKNNREYVTRLLTENRSVKVEVGGKLKTVQIIAAERAVPLKGNVPEKEYTALYKTYENVLRNTGGKRLNDIGFPNQKGDGRGHNIYFVKGRGGKRSFKIFDYAFQDL